MKPSTRTQSIKMKPPTCYHCRQQGHVKSRCPQPVDRKSCYQCRQPGHFARDCPSQRQVNNVRGRRVQDEYFKDVILSIECNGELVEKTMYSLIDTGSPVSLVKLSCVPDETIEPLDNFGDKFIGINQSSVVVFGFLCANIQLGNKSIDSAQFLVVPDHTMTTDALMGRDMLRGLGLGLMDVEYENGFNAIMNIDVIDNQGVVDTLKINPKLPMGQQNEIERNFEVHYRNVSQPDEPKVKGELKCNFMFTEVQYLGYRVSGEGIRPNDEGIVAIAEFAPPRDVRGVQRFLGMYAYFRKFIEGFSVLAKPLTDLTKKGVLFRFPEREMLAFTSFKSKLMATPLLTICSLRDETELHCDASSSGFGAVLMQKKSD